jgi:site-specific DNA-methyltransferase (adenine-specific)
MNKVVRYKNINIILKTNNGIIIQDDCINVLKNIPDKSQKLIYCDLPYNKTQNIWDSTLSTKWMWNEFNRLLVDNGVAVLHAMEEFSAMLTMSNLKDYKYKWFWQKDRGTGHLNAKKMPMRNIEELLVFYKNQPTYNPQMYEGEPCHSVGKAKGISQREHSVNTNYGEFTKVETEGNMKYPKTLLYFSRDKEKLHPTQKPLGLAEYIIKTYTNGGDSILDITAGVCTSGLAAEGLNRKWINIEKDYDDKGNCLGYCEKAIARFNH